LPATTHALIRALVFYPNFKIPKWEMKAEQFILDFKGVRKLINTCKKYDKFVEKEKTDNNLSEKEIRNLFLEERKCSSIS
jgi:hypothetical protein